MPPVVRRAPLIERIKARLNLADLILWLLEEYHDEAVDESLREWIVPLAVVLNVLTMMARSHSQSEASGDLFGDSDGRGLSRWLTWLASITAFSLAMLSVGNAFYAFLRSRRYRLFEVPMNEAPSTPSARRVAVASSPLSSSPMRLIKSLVLPAGPESTTSPDSSQYVWEVSIWDPKPFNLELLTLFSPGHIMIYWVFLPTTVSDPRPSVTIFTTIVVSALLSFQLGLLRSKFLQQAIDNKLINKQVMNEYNTKFVHPSLNRPVRDVGVQTRESSTGAASRSSLVDIYTATTNIKKSFQVNPNPSYSSLLGYQDDVYDTPTRRLPRSSTTSALLTRPAQVSTGTQSPLRPINANGLGTPSQASSRRGDGGSLGVYSHHASPLKKAASANHLRPDRNYMGAGSPLKRSSLANEYSSSSDAVATADVRHRAGRDRLSQRFGNLQNSARRDTSYN